VKRTVGALVLSRRATSLPLCPSRSCNRATPGVCGAHGTKKGDGRL
jgi:hypothetical protein